MTNIFEETLRAVEKGGTFNCNLKKRNLTVNGKKIICNGKFEGNLGIEFHSMQGVIDKAEEYFVLYYSSVPSPRWDNKRRKLFKSLPLSELSKDDILYGEDRYVAQCRLELHLLLNILAGVLTWDLSILGEHSTFFWRSTNIPQFVLFRDWIA
jgi:hypothetical protein